MNAQAHSGPMTSPSTSPRGEEPLAVRTSQNTQHGPNTFIRIVNVFATSCLPPSYNTVYPLLLPLLHRHM
ncbi:hypothetical protein KGM_215343 [Danaus plexippus plexippus]|uniref:Uncharacterized protein n=1 Tax=Danaus plexippus plexippus TaxID=278856 RepID=A0A212F5G0_DANPL|nr:hypothetical protein KGM_215343 [Danaus plexippus plexippus]